MAEERGPIETAEVILGDKTDEGFRPVGIETSRGLTSTRWYVAPNARAGVIYVGGVGGGFDSPAAGLYSRLCEELAEGGIEGLRVQFRDSRDIEESVFDTLAGIAFLESQGVEGIGLVGHSLGGAVVIRAATIAPSVRTVIAISTQAFGADVVDQIAEDTSLLLLHGEGDQVLSPEMSEFVFEKAHEPKQLLIVPEGSHVLDEVAEQVHAHVRSWLIRELAR